MKKPIGKWIGISMAAIIMMIGLAACSSDSEGIKDEYTVATDTSFVPFEFKEDDEYVGFDIDLINAIADEVGFDINLETTNFDGIIPGLQTGKFDMALAGIGITDERAEKIDYSDPYYESGLQIGIAPGNDEIDDIDDLAGKDIATRLGSTSADYIEENIDDAEADQYEQLDQAYLAVENGDDDAILYDQPNVAYYIQTKGEDKLEMVGDLHQAEDYGIAFAKDQDDLVDEVNEALETLKEDGTYDEIYEEWFGEKPD